MNAIADAEHAFSWNAGSRQPVFMFSLFCLECLEHAVSRAWSRKAVASLHSDVPFQALHYQDAPMPLDPPATRRTVSFFPFSLQQFRNSMSAERPHRLHVKTLMLPVPFEASPDICLVLQVQLRESQGCSFRESISNVGCKERSFICKQV